MNKKKRERFNIEEFLKNNNAIFNYIYDKNYLKQGIVIAFPSELKGRCKIGWALFTEVSNEEKEISKFRDLPIIRNKLTEIKNALYNILDTEDKNTIERKEWISLIQNIRSLEGFDLGENALYYYPVKASEWENLFNLAKSRANYDGWNYYCAKGTTLERTDLRNNYISTLNTENTYGVFASDINTSAGIRKAVRKMEYRAWKYFK